MEGAVAADDAVAGDDEGEGVGGHDAADGAGGAGPTDFSGEPAVGASPAGGDAQRLLQHGATEARQAVPVEGGGEVEGLALGKGAQAAGQVTGFGLGGGLAGAHLGDLTQRLVAAGAGEGGGAKAARGEEQAYEADLRVAEVEPACRQAGLPGRAGQLRRHNLRTISQTNRPRRWVQTRASRRHLLLAVLRL